MISRNTSGAEITCGLPTGLTFIPTTSPGSTNNFQADCTSGAPVNVIMPLRIILATGSAWYAPEMMDPGCSTATTLPRYRPGIRSLVAELLEDTCAEEASCAAVRPPAMC